MSEIADYLSFSEQLFNNPPKGPNQIQLEMFDESMTSEEIFQELLMIFTEGMKIKFGENDRVDLSKITENDFNLINEYFKSFGFNIFYDIKPLNQDNRRQETDNLKENVNDYYFRLVSNNLVYYISFDFYLTS